MRRSARDLGAPGRDRESGFGLLNVPAALAHPAPIRDPLEPNDDVDLVDPEATDSVGLRPLTARGRPTARLAARLDALEDPRDVYRVWLPRNRTLVVSGHRPRPGRRPLALATGHAHDRDPPARP